MKAVPPRALNPDEIAVVQRVLARASIGLVPPGLLDSVETLIVVGECECACRSLYFQAPGSGEYRVADGVGHLPSGERVNILLWASADQLTTLEVVDHAGAGDLALAESVCSWEEAGRREAKQQAV